MRYTLLIAALAASTFAASPAFAQALPVATAHDDATARGTVLGAYSFVKSADLDFGVVAVDPVTGGTVSIDPSTSPNRTAGGAGGVSLLASNSVSAAKFDGHGAPNESVSVAITTPSGNSINDGAGNSIPMALTLVANSNTTTQNLTADSNGGFTVYVGGTFTLAGGQSPGVYSNTFRVTATYQ